jgi:hypothetical protein
LVLVGVMRSHQTQLHPARFLTISKLITPPQKFQAASI